jgi:hypothetical protein
METLRMPESPSLARHKAERCPTISITKSGNPVSIETSEITSIKWDPPILTLLLFKTVLMNFPDSDAELAYETLSSWGIRQDDTLGTARYQGGVNGKAVGN